MARAAVALSLALGLGACAPAVDTPTRNALPYDAMTAPLAEEAAAMPDITVTELRVDVPRSLDVSEANRYYPGGDIVWREDPPGDRHAQVAAIVRDGLEKGLSGLNGSVPVIVEAEVARFHALTQKARYTIGGVHAIQFYLTVAHAETGEVLLSRHFVKADFRALGGDEALQAEAEGLTQKVRITEHLAGVILDELRDPGGRRAEANGLIGAINQL